MTVDGDQVKHLASNEVAALSTESAAVETEPETIIEKSGGEESTEAVDTGGEKAAVTANGANNEEAATKVAPPPKTTGQSGPRAVFNVNVTLDSSLDIEKLQKQLELLKRFGAI